MRIIILIVTACCYSMTSAQTLKEQAEAGDMNAQYNYAFSFSNNSEATQSNDPAEQMAFNWFLKAAQQGHDEAQNNVAFRYYCGKGVAQDYAKAFYWYQKSANQGNKVAIYNMGICYQYGNGVLKSLSKAFECYKKSADKGYNFAKQQLANCYNKGIGTPIDYLKAYNLYSELCKKCDPTAEYELANMLLKGTGINPDTIRAANLLLESAGGGEMTHNRLFSYHKTDANLNARNLLFDLTKLKHSQYNHYILALAGSLCEAECDYEKAEFYYKRSIENNGVLGMIRLGLMYFYISANDETQQFYHKYGNTGLTDLDMEAWGGLNETQVKKYLQSKKWESNDNVVFWLEKAIEYGYGNYIEGCMPYNIYDFLFECYYNGINNHKDIDQAIETAYKSLIATSNNETNYDGHIYRASLILLTTLNNQRYASHSFQVCERLYETIKDPYSGYSPAVRRLAASCLGQAYYGGLGTTKDYDEAFRLLNIAAELKDSESMRLLSACYRYGRGVARNQNKEAEWLKKAEEEGDPKAKQLSQMASKIIAKQKI